MIVAGKNAVNSGQVIKTYSRVTVPPRSKKGDWADPLGPDRISKEVETSALQQQRRMIHKSYEQIVSVNTSWRLRPRHCADKFSPRADLATCDPLEKLRETMVRHAGIEEAAAREMIGSLRVPRHPKSFSKSPSISDADIWNGCTEIPRENKFRLMNFLRKITT